MARQLDVRSPSTPPPVDIDTPDGSVFGDYTSSETQYEYPWPEKVWQNIEEYKRWLNDEWERVEFFQYQGPTGGPWPKKPRVDFKKLDEGAKMRTKVLCGQELHSYLVENCAISDEIAWPETPAEGFSSLEKMKAHLKAGWEMLKQYKNKSLAFHLVYGKMLNEAFTQHELEKDEGKTDSTWEEWLKENVGPSAPQGRKIRVIASLLAPYPGFTKLGLSFSEVYSRRKQISIMLAAPSQQWSNYWRQA